jgi:hypothetical protein
MSTKAQRLLASAKRSASNARKKAKQDRSAAVRKVAVVGGGYAIGKAVANGAIENVPTIFGIPRLAVLAGVTMLAAEYVPGTAGDVAEGIGDAALAIAGYQKGLGDEVSGASAEVVREHERVAGYLDDPLEEQDDDMVEGIVAGYEDALSEMAADDADIIEADAIEVGPTVLR